MNPEVKIENKEGIKNFH